MIGSAGRPKPLAPRSRTAHRRSCRNPIRRTPWLAAAVVLLLAADVCAAELAKADDVSAPVVRYHDGRLSARIQGVPLDEVLHAVSAETGVRFDGTPIDERDVFKRFDDVPLAEALRRLIGRQNFTLVYGAGGQPERVKLLGAPALPVARGSQAPPGASFEVVWRDNRRSPSPIGSPLPSAPSTDRFPWPGSCAGSGSMTQPSGARWSAPSCVLSRPYPRSSTPSLPSTMERSPRWRARGVGRTPRRRLAPGRACIGSGLAGARHEGRGALAIRSATARLTRFPCARIRPRDPPPSLLTRADRGRHTRSPSGDERSAARRMHARAPDRAPRRGRPGVATPRHHRRRRRSLPA